MFSAAYIALSEYASGTFKLDPNHEERPMYDSIRFTNPFSTIGMQPCSLCTMREAEFYYDLSAGSEESLQELRGTCCINCATRMLQTMQQLRHPERQEVLESTSRSASMVV